MTDERRTGERLRDSRDDRAEKVRVVLADDEALIRAGLAMLLAVEPDMEVVGEAADGTECLAMVATTRPDVVVMDVRMPVLNGIEATKRLLSGENGAAAKPPAVLILTTFNEDQSVVSALRAGASGFLLKNSAPQTLARAIRGLAKGEGWLDPSVTKSLLNQFSTHDAVVGDVLSHTDIDVLTPRERDVLMAMSKGLKNAQIAELLFLSETTVKTHVHRILLKLGLSDRSQAVAVAFRSGLVSFD
jgi:DNA-binding NarL/FixJ family response regulator